MQISEIYILHHIRVIFENNEYIPIISFTGDFAYVKITDAYKAACDYIVNQGWSEVFTHTEDNLFWDKFFMYYEKENHYEKAYEMINSKFSNMDDFPKIEKFLIK